MGPEGEIGCFNDRIEALTATADVMSLPLDMVDMGDTFHDLPDGDCWMTVTERAEPYKPPYIPPTLDWQIEGLIEEGSPVVDTSESAQWGWRGHCAQSAWRAAGLLDHPRQDRRHFPVVDHEHHLRVRPGPLASSRPEPGG